MLVKITHKFKIFKKNKGAFLGLIFLFFLITASCLISIFPSLSLVRKNNDVPFHNLQLPGSYSYLGSQRYFHLMGTDYYGNDIFSRILFAFFISFSISFLATTISLFVGTILAIIAGYFRGFFDYLISFLCDFLLVFPGIVFIILMKEFFGNNFFNLILVLSIFFIIKFIKVVRTQILEICQKDFIKTANSLGASHLRIIFKHILPGIIPTLIISVNHVMVSMMIFISSLSIIGLGLDKKIPELGMMIAEGRDHFERYPHLIFFPLVVIFLNSLSFYLIGEGLSHVFDPKKQNI